MIVLIFVISIIFHGSYCQPPQPDEYEIIGGNTGVVRVQGTKRTYAGAKQYCEDLGTVLFTYTSDERASQCRGDMQRREGVWIGLERGVNRGFIWLSGMQFTWFDRQHPWHHKEPGRRTNPGYMRVSGKVRTNKSPNKLYFFCCDPS